MKRIALIAIVAWMTTAQSPGVVVVEDLGTELNTLLTQVKAYASYALQTEQYISQLDSLIVQGTPSNMVLSAIPGASLFQMAAATAALAQNDVEQLQSLIPQANTQAGYNSVLQAFGLPVWNGQTDLTSYQFATNQYLIATMAERQIAALSNLKGAVQSAIQENVNAESSATTNAAPKYAATISALKSLLSEINEKIHEIQQQTNLAGQQLVAAQSIYQRSQDERNNQWYQQSADMLIGGTPTSGNFALADSSGGNVLSSGTSTEFGWSDNPAIGGSGDSGTSGNWYTGAGGQDIGAQNANYVSLPASTEIAQYGSIQAAQNQPVTVIDNQTGQKLWSSIGDVGPGNSAVARGVTSDLTHGAVTQLGISGGTGNVTIVKGHQ